jgi:hypothetical protein
MGNKILEYLLEHAPELAEEYKASEQSRINFTIWANTRNKKLENMLRTIRSELNKDELDAGLAMQAIDELLKGE